MIGKWLARIGDRCAIIRGARKAKVDETLLGVPEQPDLHTVVHSGLCRRSAGSGRRHDRVSQQFLRQPGSRLALPCRDRWAIWRPESCWFSLNRFELVMLLKLNPLTGTVVEIQICNTILLTLDNVQDHCSEFEDDGRYHQELFRGTAATNRSGCGVRLSTTT